MREYQLFQRLVKANNKGEEPTRVTRLKAQVLCDVVNSASGGTVEYHLAIYSGEKFVSKNVSK